MLTFADRILFAGRRTARLALTHDVTRLARGARASRPHRWTCPGPAPSMPDALTRALRWPWCGGYVQMAEAAGIRRLESSCVRWVPACEGPTHAFTSMTSDPAALAA